MAWKNYKKIYHSKRIGKRYVEEGFPSSWHSIQDWKIALNTNRPYLYGVILEGANYQLHPKLRGWFVHKGVRPEDITEEQANNLYYWYTPEIKKVVSSGGYSRERKTFIKRVFNKKMRQNAKSICRSADAYEEDSVAKINPYKDRRFAWIVD